MTKPQKENRPAPELPQLLTLGDVAARLAISMRTVHRLIALGELRIVRLRVRHGRTMPRVTVDELARFIAAGSR